MGVGLPFAVTSSLAVTLCSVARAEDLTPTGVGWYCTTISNKYNAKDRAGRCFRSEEICNSFQAELAEADFPGALVSNCRFQKNASALTYFDVMNEVTRFQALPSTAMCNELRTKLARDKDNQKVTACKLVGDRKAKPGKFNSDAVAKGTDWYCTRRAKPSLDVCLRSETKCNEIVEDEPDAKPCTRQSTAIGLTWPSSEASDDAFYGEARTPGRGIGAFRSNADCKRFREQIAGSAEGVSPCVPVSSVQTSGAADRSLIPEGSTWFCYALATLPKGWNRDICFRDERSCKQMREDVAKLKHDPRECAPTSSAYAFTSQQYFFAFPTKDQCEQVAADDEYASRCELVGDIGGPAAPARPAARPAAPAVEDSLTRAMIWSGIDSVRGRITACGDKSPVSGRLKVRVTVRPDGSVDNIVVETALDSAIDACVVAAIKSVTFAKTRRGGNFSYPFVF